MTLAARGLVVLLFSATAFVVRETSAGEGGYSDLMMNSQLNAVPRIGRRSLNPFQQGSAFRFARPRRFWSPFSGMGFRFYGDEDSDLSEPRHKKREPEVTSSVEPSAAVKRTPRPHPLPRPYPTVKADQSFWEDLVGKAARDSIVQKLAQAALEKSRQHQQSRMDTTNGMSPLASFLSRYGGRPTR